MCVHVCIACYPKYMLLGFFFYRTRDFLSLIHTTRYQLVNHLKYMYSTEAHLGPIKKQFRNSFQPGGTFPVYLKIYIPYFGSISIRLLLEFEITNLTKSL